MVSNKTKNILDGYVEYLENLSPSTIDALNKYVSNNVRFKDPFNDVTGIEKMKVVFRHMFENIQNIKFEVHKVYFNGEGGCLEWTFCGILMNKQWSFDGVSTVIFDSNGLIVEHLDYWDAASSFYEKIPVLGWLFKCIGNRLKIEP